MYILLLIGSFAEHVYPEQLDSLISVRAMFCYIYWKYTFLFSKPTSLPFVCRKGHKLLLIFSRVATSSRIKTKKRDARKACC